MLKWKGRNLVLHKEVADEFGVEIDTVKCGDFSSTVRAAGVVLTASSADAVVSAPTAGVVRILPGIEAGRTLPEVPSGGNNRRPQYYRRCCQCVGQGRTRCRPHGI